MGTKDLVAIRLPLPMLQASPDFLHSPSARRRLPQVSGESPAGAPAAACTAFAADVARIGRHPPHRAHGAVHNCCLDKYALDLRMGIAQRVGNLAMESRVNRLVARGRSTR